MRFLMLCLFLCIPFLSFSSSTPESSISIEERNQYNLIVKLFDSITFEIKSFEENPLVFTLKIHSSLDATNEIFAQFHSAFFYSNSDAKNPLIKDPSFFQEKLQAHIYFIFEKVHRFESSYKNSKESVNLSQLEKDFLDKISQYPVWSFFIINNGVTFFPILKKNFNYTLINKSYDLDLSELSFIFPTKDPKEDPFILKQLEYGFLSKTIISKPIFNKDNSYQIIKSFNRFKPSIFFAKNDIIPEETNNTTKDTSSTDSSSITEKAPVNLSQLLGNKSLSSENSSADDKSSSTEKKFSPFHFRFYFDNALFQYQEIEFFRSLLYQIKESLY